jgi:hypothetical protein
MQTYARIVGAVVMELFTTSLPIASLFPASMVWVNVTATPSVQVGWVQLPNGTFAAPASQTPTIPPVTLAGVQAQLTALQAQVNQLIAAGA